MSDDGSIQSFGNKGTEDIFDGKNTKKARQLLHPDLHSKAQRIMDALDSGTAPMNLPIYSPEPLTGYDYWFSLRIDKQNRVVCIWDDDKNEAHQVEITDYHD